jgi:hypothetical protein
MENAPFFGNEHSSRFDVWRHGMPGAGYLLFYVPTWLGLRLSNGSSQESLHGPSPPGECVVKSGRTFDL